MFTITGSYADTSYWMVVKSRTLNWYLYLILPGNFQKLRQIWIKSVVFELNVFFDENVGQFSIPLFMDIVESHVLKTNDEIRDFRNV